MRRSLANRRAQFRERAFAVLANLLDRDGRIARGWLRPDQSPGNYLACRLAGTLSRDCPREVLLKKAPRRKLSPITIERRVEALIELEQLWDRPVLSRPGATAAEREADAIEAALYRRSLALRAGLMNRRKQAAMWQQMKSRLAQLRKVAPAVVQ